MSTSAPEIVWTPHAGRTAALAAFAVASAILVLGWTTGLRHVLHALLLAASLIAFFPFVLLASLAALILLFGVMLALAAALSGGDGVLDGLGSHAVVAAGGDNGSRVSRWVHLYYRFLARRRHPAWLGASAGVLFGSLLCWALLAAFVVPKETSTMQTLVQAQVHLAQLRSQAGHYPLPDAHGHFVTESGVLTDAFGNAVVYELQGRRGAQSYRLTSLGADGRSSSDDLCVAAKTGLAALAERIVQPLAALELLRGESSTWNTRLEALRASSCNR
jgi:hypothetical protein